MEKAAAKEVKEVKEEVQKAEEKVEASEMNSTKYSSLGFLTLQQNFSQATSNLRVLRLMFSLFFRWRSVQNNFS